jgi:hypothetical protein
VEGHGGGDGTHEPLVVPGGNLYLSVCMCEIVCVCVCVCVSEPALHQASSTISTAL